MAVKTFNISFPKELADLVDKKAKEQFGSRSDFLRYAAWKYLREEQEWKELMAYGKELGKKVGYQSEEEVADEITAERRKTRRWKPQDYKNSH
ncbi:MAG: ribbon-helix-helix domain-containing protein [Patescibacteria group bacterium]